MIRKIWLVIIRFILAAGWIILFTIPHSVSPQNSVRFSSVSVDLLPEYDRSSLLVVSRMTLAPETSLPTQVTLSIPVEAEIWAVAETDSSGTLVNAVYSLQIVEGENLLTISVNSLFLQVEYYADLEITGTQHRLSYTWSSGYEVQNLSLDFRAPSGASGLSFSPQMPNVITGTDGLTHYQSAPISLSAGDEYSLEVEYQRDSDALAVTEDVPVPVSFVASTLSQFWKDNQTVILVILLSIAILAGLAIGIGYWQTNRKRGSSRKRHPRSSAGGTEQKRVVYCSQCGEASQPGDTFCRACGSRLRRVT